MHSDIMVKKVLILIATALGAVSLGAQQRMTTEEVRAELRANPNKYVGVYFFYDLSDREMCEAPKGFKPFYVSTYTRHGARYILTEKQYDHVHKSLTEAYESGNLTPFGKEIHDRFEGIYPFLKNKAGELTPSGKKQHKELGDRLYRNYPEVFKGSSRVIAHSTDVPRTIQSMTYFLEGMREHNRKMEITEYASKADKHFLNPHSSFNINQDIVAAGEFGVEAETFHGALDDGELALLVVDGFGDDEGEVEVAVVVVDGATAGLAAHEKAPIGLKGLDVDLAIGVLVLSDDDGAAVAPQIERDGISRLDKIILDGDIPIRLRLIRNDILQFH